MFNCLNATDCEGLDWNYTLVLGLIATTPLQLVVKSEIGKLDIGLSLIAIMPLVGNGCD